MSDRDRNRADDGDGEGPSEAKDPEEEKCKGCERKGKKMSFFRKKKSKKVRPQKQRGAYVNSRRLGGGGVGGGWLCCLCVSQPRTLDSAGESPSSDPNSSEFSFDMLRALIEKNDFYSKECNPHLDADDGNDKENLNSQN